MIAELLDGLQWHSIYGIRADKFFCVQHIAVSRVLRTGTGPQGTLYMCAAMFKRLEARRMENLLEFLVDDASVGNRGFAFERFVFLLLRTITGGLRFIFQQFIYQSINAADEEAGDGADGADIFARAVALFQRADVGFCDLFIGFEGEDKRDVDIDAFDECLPDGR